MYKVIRPKAYCEKCRHFRHGYDHGADDCAIIDPTTANYKTERYRTYEPSRQNKLNDCKYWQHKRGLIEWVYDLLN